MTPARPLVASYWTIAGNSYPGAADESSPWPLRERMEAAARAGFAGFGLLINDVRDLLRDGTDEFADRFDALGFSVLELEVLTGWYLPLAQRGGSDRALDDFIAFAERVPTRHLKIGGDVDPVPAELDALVDGLQRVGDRVRHTGMQLTLEFMPFSTIPTLRLARDAVAGADRDGIGLLLDIWHVARSHTPYADLAQLPPGLVNYVEIDDAPLQAERDLFQETIHGRLLPGEGELRVPEFLSALNGVYDGPIGVEVIGREHRALDLADAAKRSADAARGVVEPAG